MSDGTVKVTAEAHMHISQLNASLGSLNDLLSQVVSHGTALTDPNVWAGPAASVFAQQVWPQVQSQLGQLQGSMGQLQQQVSTVINNITQAGSGLLGGGLPLGGLNSLPLSGLPIGGL
jgi:hypothetical protein